jgi:RNA polymerase sigma factor (sigma-70 family)
MWADDGPQASQPSTAQKGPFFALSPRPEPKGALSSKKRTPASVPQPGQPAMDGPSDGELLLDLERGLPSALTELVARHQGALLRHARALLGEGGGYEDAVQDVFLKLLQKPPQLPAEVRGDHERERSHLLSWLHKVTRNGCMDTLRSETRRKAREEKVAAPETASDGRARGAALVEQADTREDAAAF